MSNEYTYVSPLGVKHHLTQKHLDESFRILTLAGYAMQDALDIALDYTLARINVSELTQTDLLYNQHDQQESDHLCGLVAKRLAQRGVNL